MDDDMDQFECGECGMLFSVIWNLDAMAYHYESCVNHCPRCGSEDLTMEESDG